MAGTSKRRNDVALQEEEGASPVLAALERLVLTVLVMVQLAFLFLPLISVFISRSPLPSRKKFLGVTWQIGQGNQLESRPIP
jgi:hypothetical protein